MRELFSTRDIASAAAFGFGASVGRDVWKWFRNNTAQAAAWLVLLGAFTLPILSGKGFTEGHDRGFAGTVFKTFAGNTMLLIAGIALSWLCLLLPFYDETRPAESAMAALLVAVVWCVALLVCGGLWGLLTRPKRKRAYSVARQNAEFLSTTGISETKASDATHIGPDGERLRLLGEDDGSLAFMVVGRRSQRAYIAMDGHGRFMSYSGPTRI